MVKDKLIGELLVEGEQHSLHGKEYREVLMEDLECEIISDGRVFQHKVKVKPGRRGGFAANGVDGADEGGGGGGVDDLDLMAVGDFGLLGPVAVGKGLALDFLGVDLLIHGMVPFPKIGDGLPCASGGGDS